MVSWLSPVPLVAGVSFCSFKDSEDRIIKRKQCKKLAKEGELGQEQIMERYTKQVLIRSGEQLQLHEKFQELWRIGQPAQESLQANFLGCFLLGDHAPRPQDRNIPSTRFLASLSAPFGQYSTYIQPGLDILYRVFHHYSQHPFPTSLISRVSEDALYRGILFLAGLYEWPAKSGSNGPCQCGPYRGNGLTHRATTSYDERRRMFRFLATPTPVSLYGRPNDNLPAALIPVPQFTYDISPNNAQERFGEYSSTADKVIIQDYEDEREVDLLDVLLETYPSIQDEKTSKTVRSSVTNGPYRDSFRYIIPTLPRHETTLDELNLTFVDWRAFLELLLVSSFGVFPAHLGPMFEQNQVLQYVLDAMCFAFVQNEGDALYWSAFNAVIPRSMPALFRNPPDDGLTNLFRPFLQPQAGLAAENKLIPRIPHTLLSYPRLAQLRTFIDPFSRCKLFFGSHARIVDHNTLKEFRGWRGHRYIFISGYEKQTYPLGSHGLYPLGHQDPMPLQKVFVGMTIHGPVIGPLGSRPQRENNSECEIQAFRLSPEHRVYGFEPARMRLDPMMSVKFGLRDDDWENATMPTGRTRIAFMEDMNECIFEHGGYNDPNESQRWVNFGRGNPGVRKITVEAWEVWGFV